MDGHDLNQHIRWELLKTGTRCQRVDGVLRDFLSSHKQMERATITKSAIGDHLSDQKPYWSSRGSRSE